MKESMIGLQKSTITRLPEPLLIPALLVGRAIARK